MSDQQMTSLCEASGVYATSCDCDQLEAIVKGMAFPPCRQCGEEVEWTLFLAP